MRLRCAPLAAGDSDHLPLLDDGGVERAALCHHRLAWLCRDTPLDLRVISTVPLMLPESEPTEPVVGAIARVLAALRASDSFALALLADPAVALGEHAVALAEGVRLFAICDEDDEACWDAALSRTQPVYGICGECVVDVRHADPMAALTALGYGAFTCAEGLDFAELIEDRIGTRWRIDADGVKTTVVVRGGFEAATIGGAAGTWIDRGDEGYVRLVARSGERRCWSQPRFVAPRTARTTHA